MVLALGLFPFEIRELMSSESIKASFSKLLWTAFAGRSALWLPNATQTRLFLLQQ